MDTSPRSQIITVSVMAGILFLAIFYYFAQQIIKVQHWLQDAGRIQNRIQELPPLTMPELIRGPEAEEMARMYLEAAPLSRYYRIPNSSALYLTFSNFNLPEEIYKQSAHPFIQSTTNVSDSVAVIDLENPDQSFFTTLFRTEMNSPLGRHSYSRKHEIRSLSACLLNSVPSVILYRQDHFLTDEELADPNYKGNYDWANSINGYFSLDSTGFYEVRHDKTTYDYFEPIQGIPFLFGSSYPFRLMEIDEWEVRERYVILDPNKQTQYWQQGRLTHLEFQALREDLVFGSNRKHTKIAFYTTQPQPVFREFEAKELFDLLPIQPEDLSLEYYQSLHASPPMILPATLMGRNIPEQFRNYDPAKNEWQQWHRDPLRLKPLSQGTDTTLLVILFMPNYPILRIHIDKITNGSLSEIVEYIGNCDDHFPQISLANDHVVVFNAKSTHERFIPRQTKLAWTYSIARFLNNSHLGPIETITAELPHETTDFISSSILSYDDDHFLLEFDNAFYTLRWDGTEMKRVFPR